MAWKIHTDATFWPSVWTLQKELEKAYARKDSDAEKFQGYFDQFYEVLVRFLDDGQIGLDTLIPVVLGGVDQEGHYLLQIEGNPFEAYFKLEGRPIFGGKAILALRAPPTDAQLKVITDRLAAARQRPESAERSRQ